MKHHIVKGLSATLGLMLINISILFVTDATAQLPGTKTSVKVSKEVRPDRVIYHYRFINESKYPVGAVVIGSDYLHGSNVELVEPPKGSVPSDEDRIPPGALIAPPGWKAKMMLQDDTDSYAVEFQVSPHEFSNYLAPGKEASGFSIVVAKEDNSLLKSHYIFSVRGSTALYGQLAEEPFDGTPPTLSLSASPSSVWPPNGKMTPVTVAVTVSDDRDPAPSVKLVSVTCNDGCKPEKDISGAEIGKDDRSFSIMGTRLGARKDGRTYTATYSATNVSGNSVQKSVTILIPHDQAKKYHGAQIPH